ncbi:hypothetical protein ASD11_13135 [Aeromicrobium sp. Root495]|nr:hypothetical protein ASD11_13135 [Aeromicrobium sp. Root495]
MGAWFERRTLGAGSPDPAALAAAKAGRRVSVVLPARDEAATVGTIVSAVRSGLVDQHGLVDEVIVVDSRSTDDTARVARAAGARVVPSADVVPGLDGGKGAALRTGIEEMDGDLGVFLDADVREFGVAFVLGLLAPLLTDPDLVLVKGFYDRPWDVPGDEARSRPAGGGRVTELVARPLIARHAPELAGFVQPLAGEVAFVRAAVLDLPVVSGYGVDIAMLLQTARRHGLDALAQADLGRRLHHHQDLDALGRMALQVRAAFELVAPDGPDVVVDERTRTGRGADGQVVLETESVTTRLLPPPGR